MRIRGLYSTQFDEGAWGNLLIGYRNNTKPLFSDLVGRRFWNRVQFVLFSFFHCKWTQYIKEKAEHSHCIELSWARDHAQFFHLGKIWPIPWIESNQFAKIQTGVFVFFQTNFIDIDRAGIVYIFVECHLLRIQKRNYLLTNVKAMQVILNWP